MRWVIRFAYNDDPKDEFDTSNEEDFEADDKPFGRIDFLFDDPFALYPLSSAF